MTICVYVLYGNNKNHLMVERAQFVNLETLRFVLEP